MIPQDQNVGCELHKEVELKAYRMITIYTILYIRQCALHQCTGCKAHWRIGGGSGFKKKQKEIQRKHYFELQRKDYIIRKRERKVARRVFIKSKGRIELMHIWDKRILIEKF